MPTALIAGLATHYAVQGSGPPLLLLSPGGFDATLHKWSAIGIYAKTRLLEQLTSHFSCIVFDRRECGLSGGRIERITWAHYAAQAKGLLDHLEIPGAHVLGGCMGCAPAVAFGVAYPQATRSLVLVWPVGGALWRISGQQRFALHLAQVQQHGMASVVELARSSGKGFGEDPRVGPWAAVIRNDAAFAEAFMVLDVERYKLALNATARALFDRDTAPGAEPEELLRLDVPTLVVPGRDASHATSAARYLEECIPGAEYWDAAPAEQTDATLPPRVLSFLASAESKQ